MILIVYAIVLGAFGAHGLKTIVSAEKILSFETGVTYQMYHGLALLAIGLNFEKLKNQKLLFFKIMITGVLFFSLSIYLLTLSEFLGIPKAPLIPLTPLGGLLMIISWVIFISQNVRSIGKR